MKNHLVSLLVLDGFGRFHSTQKRVWAANQQTAASIACGQVNGQAVTVVSVTELGTANR